MALDDTGGTIVQGRSERNSAGRMDAKDSAAASQERLILNAAPIVFSAPRVVLGRLPYEGEEAYRELREKYRGTHTFRFDNRENHILNIGIDPSVVPLGERDEVATADHLLLLGKAVQQSLLRWLSSRRTILRPARPLQCWGNRKAALLSATIKELNLRPCAGLDVLVRHSFDTRVLQAPGNNPFPFLALIVDVNTSNEIDIPVSKLIAAGMDVIGKYVGRRGEARGEEVLPRFDIYGRIAGVEGRELVLTDTSFGERCAAETIILEQRQENLGRGYPAVLSEAC